MKLSDFGYADWLPLLSKIWEIFKDKDFDYDDREATLEAARMAIKEVGEEMNWPVGLIAIRQNIAVSVFEEIFWHMKPKAEPSLPI